MTLLICGAQGQVGQELLQRAPTGTVALGRQELDLTDDIRVREVIARIKPKVVINAAAYTAVDKAESEHVVAHAINADGPGYLARACAKSGAALLHISTDYVFDGLKRSPYRPEDPVNPQGAYARSKWEGEQQVRSGCEQHLILRTSWVFGAHGNNFVKTMLRLARERSELRIVADQHGGPTPAASLAEALLAIAGRIESNRLRAWGTYHFGGTPATTWHGFASFIIEEAFSMGLLPRKPAIHPIRTLEYPLPAPRPANSVLDMQRTQEQLQITAPDWQAGLRDILKTWAMIS